MAYVQVTDVLDWATDMSLKEVSDLAAKCDVIEQQGADVMLAVILDHEVAFFWPLAVGLYMFQNPDLIPYDLCVLPLGAFGPDRGPIANPVKAH